MSEQERISSYNINTVSTRQVMRMKININKGLKIVLIPIHLKEHQKN